MRTELLRVAPQHLTRLLLDALTKVDFPAGERIVHQGTTGDRLFILHKGSCIVNLEKGQELHSIGRLKTGDVFGEMALITGDYRSAHIDAETEVAVWTLDRVDFERICDGCHELVEYLTDLATERLCSRRITAEKNIGRYRITDVIAEGGWSIVFKGSHSALGLPVAVKMLKHSMALDSDFFATFRKEAETIAGLNHEHVYKTVFIIMEYLSGITLRQIIASLRVTQSRRICVQGTPAIFPKSCLSSQNFWQAPYFRRTEPNRGLECLIFIRRRTAEPVPAPGAPADRIRRTKLQVSSRGVRTFPAPLP
jgi:eukaryotic-like serine/threonine-protein kinase